METFAYYQTEIGIGFAGYCFEALTIIALISRCLEQLSTNSEASPRPYSGGIVNLAKEIIVRYFRDHNVPDKQTVEFLGIRIRL